MAALLLLAGSMASHAQNPIVAAPTAGGQTKNTAPDSSSGLTLRDAVEAAWRLQPASQAADARREAATAQQRVASSWTAGPLSLEGSWRTDRFSRNEGLRELEAGIAVPLWLPGERSRSRDLADGERAILDSQTAAQRLQVAGLVRDAWWAVLTARQERTLAADRLAAAQALADDVGRRVRAGDLARADQNQADAAVLAARAELAGRRAAATAAESALQALIGRQDSETPLLDVAEPEPAAEQPEGSRIDAHPRLRVAGDRAEVARRKLALTAAQRSGNPELAVVTTRDRGSAGDPTVQTVTIGVRVPIGTPAAQRVRTATASAELAEAEAELRSEAMKLESDLVAAQARVQAARLGAEASAQRARLARQTQVFVDRAFRAGESDLPTRLRVELEAVQAEREAARAQLDLGHALSQWRQALGLLPP